MLRRQLDPRGVPPRHDHADFVSGLEIALRGAGDAQLADGDDLVTIVLAAVRRIHLDGAEVELHRVEAVRHGEDDRLRVLREHPDVKLLVQHLVDVLLVRLRLSRAESRVGAVRGDDLVRRRAAAGVEPDGGREHHRFGDRRRDRSRRIDDRGRRRRGPARVRERPQARRARESSPPP